MSYDEILVLMRKQAKILIAKAQTEVQRRAVTAANAEYVLRNRALLLAQRLKRAESSTTKRKMLDQALHLLRD